MIKFGIITVSDGVSNGTREDLSGPALAKLVEENGWVVTKSTVVPDEKGAIQDQLRSFAFQQDVDVILTTGGTGFTLSDVTPEATRAIIEKEAAPLAQIMLIESYKQNPKSVLSRGIAGIFNQKLIINLPGSPKGAVENLKVILALLPHACELLQGNATGH
jgi:molybdopterin adenylyltransferase